MFKLSSDEEEKPPTFISSPGVSNKKARASRSTVFQADSSEDQIQTKSKSKGKGKTRASRSSIFQNYADDDVLPKGKKLKPEDLYNKQVKPSEALKQSHKPRASVSLLNK